MKPPSTRSKNARTINGKDHGQGRLMHRDAVVAMGIAVGMLTRPCGMRVLSNDSVVAMPI